MKIAGIVKTSLIDYPGRAATVIFLGGCNFRCGYCHNPEIVRMGLGDGAGTGTGDGDCLGGRNGSESGSGSSGSVARGDRLAMAAGTMGAVPTNTAERTAKAVAGAGAAEAAKAMAGASAAEGASAMAGASATEAAKAMAGASAAEGASAMAGASAAEGASAMAGAGAAGIAKAVVAAAMTEAAIEVADFLAFIDGRKRFLDAVCVSGGEPTLYPELPGLLREIRRRGLAVKLDTNGSRPRVLEALLAEGLVDYVAMDVKGPLSLYDRITGTVGQGAAALESAALLTASCVDHEFRTTVCRELLTEAALLQMRREFPVPRRWFLQTFRNPGQILGEAGAYSAYSSTEMAALAEALGAGLR